MNNDDLRISTVDNEDASSNFLSPIQEEADARASEAPPTELAQATGNQQPADGSETAAHVVNVVPDENNVAHLPANTSIVDIRVEGSNLVLVQADGTEIVIVDGALHIPTFLIGDIALSRQAVIAALEENHINVAAGPDGTYSVSPDDRTVEGELHDVATFGEIRCACARKEIPVRLLGMPRRDMPE